MRFLLPALVLFALSAPAAAQPEDASTRAFAQRHFEQGVTHYDAGRFDEALTSFSASYELVPSPNSGLYVARCLGRLERYPEAVTMYEEVVRTARIAAEAEERYEETEQAASRELAQISDRVGRIVIRADGLPDDARITAAGREVPRAALGLPWAVPPGAVVVEATWDGGRAERVVRVLASAEVAVMLSPTSGEPATTDTPSGEPAVPPAEADDHDGGGSVFVPLAIAAGAVAAVGFGMAIGFGVAGNAKYDELAEACGTSPCPPDLSGDVADGRTFDTLANVGIVIGFVGAIATASFVVAAIATSGDESATRISIGPGSIRVSGRF